MTTVEFLSRLRSLDVKLWVEGDRLRYSAPKGALTPELRAELVERKGDILVLLRQANGATGGAPTRIPPIPRDRDLPLSFAQQRMWLLDQLVLDNPAYTIPIVVYLRGPLDLTALARSLGAIVARHEALRTTFPAVDGRPRQVIAPALPLALPVLDLGALPAVEREPAALRLTTEEARQPFDLAHGPLLRLTLLRLDRHAHRLLLTVHHIVSDGWSMGVFFRELAALYAARSSGSPARLPDLSIQYADFAAWQREWLQGELLETQLVYWKRRLAGAPPTLELPTDRPRPLVQTFAGGRRRFTLPGPLAMALKALCQREGCTLFMVLLAAFQTLLARYTGQEDILVGTPIANRTHAEIESLIGFFANTLVLRADLSGNPSFRELLRRVRDTALGAYAHQDLPFEKLVEELHPERDMGGNPLFQVAFTLRNALLPGTDLLDLRLDLAEVDNGTARFDLMLELEERPEEIDGWFEYSAALFDAATIDRMAGHFRTLVEGIVAAPERRLADLPLLTEPERQQLLVTWNGARTDYPQDATIQQLFEAQAERTPDAVALVFDRSTTEQGSGVRGQGSAMAPGNQGVASPIPDPRSPIPGPWCLTYAELNRRANRLAWHLRALGVGPEVLVAICAERSLELVVGLLGILKAGGAFVPLDPAYPAERLAFMLADTRAPVLLTQRHLLGRLPTSDQRPTTNDQRPTTDHSIQNPIVLCLDADWDAIAGRETNNPPRRAVAENLAYVMYTSGSTGVPKGVSVTQRNVVRLVKATDYAELTPDQVFLQFAPIAFDAATFELWGCLLNGARLVLFPPHFGALEELAQVLERYRVTTLWLTAGLFHQMVEQHLDDLKHVGQLLAGGDVLSVPHVLKVLEAGGRRLMNGYGPTENTTFTCCYPMTESRQVGATVPIGRPIANTRIYVLDRHLRPVPAGVPGELYAGGDGLARGYLNRPDLTAERFVPNPFAKDEGRRMKDESLDFILHPSAFILYRTGDLVRYRADGNVEFLGRIDQQVKIRGFRIELGEIEAVLGQHPAVQECVVVARADAPGEKRLVAYVVPATDKETRRQGDKEFGDASHTQSSVLSPQSLALSPQRSAPPSSFILHPSSLSAELRAFLKERLPGYMVPSAFVMLEALPLTPNGKVDRRTLPAPDSAQADTGAAFVAPRTPVEAELARMWADLLRLPRAGIHDNFFELGGHSLLATQLMAQAHTAFGAELSVHRFFEAPTIAGLAEQIERAGWRAHAAAAPPLQRVSRDRELPLSFIQERRMVREQVKPRSRVIPLALRLAGALDVIAVERSLNEIMRRHETLRTTFHIMDGRPIGRIAPAARVYLRVVDLRALPEAAREPAAHDLVLAEIEQPFDLARGSLLRALLLRLGPREHIALLSMEHVVSDGWSIRVLGHDFAALYSAFVAGAPSPLPELPIQYADYAAWERAWLQGEILAHQIAGWERRLGGFPALEVPIPPDRPRPPALPDRGESLALPLSVELSAAVKALSRQRGVSLFMLLLAAYQTLLHRYSGRQEIYVVAATLNRDRVETQALIGWFANQLVFRATFAGNPSFLELLAQVRDVVLEGYAHQELPFTELLKVLQPASYARLSGFLPIIELVDTWIEEAQLDFAGLDARPLEIQPKPLAGFALTVEDRAGRLTLRHSYIPELYEAATIAGLLADLQRILEGIITDPTRRVTDLALLAGVERQVPAA